MERTRAKIANAKENDLSRVRPTSLDTRVERRKRKETFSWLTSNINFDTRNFDMQIGVEGVLTLLTRFDTCAINRAIYVSTVCTPNTRYAGFIGNEYAHKIERYIHCYSTTFAVKQAPTFPIE